MHEQDKTNYMEYRNTRNKRMELVNLLIKRENNIIRQWETKGR